MLSTVIHAELADAEPPRLSDDELSAFFSLLFAAGAETTRNAIAGAMLAFLEWPEQLGLLRTGQVSMDTAVEEILRWTTPSPSKRRTATTWSQLGGARIGPGQKVVVWEGSANRDARRFDEPDAFLLQTRPQPAPGLRPRRPLLPRRAPGPPRDPRGPGRGLPVGRVVHSCRAAAVDAQQPAHRYPPSPVAAAEADHNNHMSPPSCGAGVSLAAACPWNAHCRGRCSGGARRGRYPGTPDTSGRCRSRTASSSLRGAGSSRVSAPKIMVARSAGSQAGQAPMPS